ncbi:MAG: hypothetical protein WCL57_13845 [Chloroflexota bacterium]|nr:hypothetical protein [Chloroflexota bacterium]
MPFHNTLSCDEGSIRAAEAGGIYFQPIFDISINGGAPKRICGIPSYEMFVAALEGRRPL